MTRTPIPPRLATIITDALRGYADRLELEATDLGRSIGKPAEKGARSDALSDRMFGEHCAVETGLTPTLRRLP